MKKTLLSVLAFMASMGAMAFEVTNTVPADGSTVSSLKSMAFEVDSYIFGINSTATCSVTDQDGNTYPATLTSTWTQSGPSDYVYAALVSLDERIYKAGTYTVTIGEGSLLLSRWSAEYNTEAMTATVTVDGTGSAEGGVQDAVTTVPAADSSVGGIDGFSVTFTDHTMVEGSPKADIIDAQNRVVATAKGVVKQENYQNTNTIEFTTTEVISLAGKYTVRIAPDQVFFDGNKYEAKNSLITFDVNVTGDYKFDNVEFSMEDYAEIKEYKDLTMTYTDYETISVPGYGSYLYFYDDKGNQVTSSSVYVSSYGSITGNSVALSLYTAFDVPGEYTLVIPKGFFLLGEDQRPCTPQSFHFTILAPEPDDVTVAPADGSEISELKQITLTFNDATEIAIPSQWTSIYVPAVGGGYRYYCTGSDMTVEGNTVTVPMTEVEGQELQAGETVTVTVPKGIFSLTTAEGVVSNQLLNLTYTVVDVATAIKAVANDPQNTQVYDLQGRKVSTMKAGQLYLIGGHATVVK